MRWVFCHNIGLSWICCWVRDRRAKSSAKSRSFNSECDVHRTPFLFFCDVDCFIIQSVTRRKRKGDSRQPCLTPVRTELTIVHYIACQFFVGVLNDAGNLFFGYSVMPQCLPKTFPLNAVKCLLIVCQIDVKWRVRLQWLLQNDLIRTRSVLPEPDLVVAEVRIDCVF